jgi:LmbE family N-acetylglucosaminyl deacetylase
MKKILVFAPHADDEILGCGGYLIHESKKGSNIRICIATIGGENKLQNFKSLIQQFIEAVTFSMEVGTIRATLIITHFNTYCHESLAYSI